MPNIQLMNNLRYLRKINGLNQDALGVVLNISRQAYSNYETGTREVDLDTLIRLAKFYNLTLDELAVQNLIRGAQTVSEEKVPYNKTIDITTQNTIYLQREETEFVVKYRSLPEHDREMVQSFLDSHALEL